MAKGKKIINGTDTLIDEILEGMELFGHGRVRKLPDATVLARTEIPDGKVALVIGGGSGHEPMFCGFVGDNLADAAACGNIFAAPAPDTILAAVKAAHRGAGVLFVYGNYAGDNMNFDMAAELAEDEGIAVRTVRVWDDVAAAPPDRLQDRRGIAGDVFVIKVAGAAAAELATLDEVARVAAKARDNTRSLGVAVRAGSLPQTGEPTFELGEDEIEIGMGGHGEPGVSREKIKPADALATDMMTRILDDMALEPGAEVALLLDDLGATTMMELAIVNRTVRRILRERGIAVHATDVGKYLTTQEMAGFSITLMQLDDELRHYLEQPARGLGYRHLGGRS